MMEKVFGFKLSKIDGSEKIFSSATDKGLPKKYSYQKYLPEVLNQGEMPFCVPYSLSTYLNWNENLKDGTKKDNKINYQEIYKIKTTEGEGMQIKEALSYLKHHGVSSKAGNLKINGYAMIRNAFSLKSAIIMNGPCFGALPVYNESKEFWNKQVDNQQLMGYHAISIVGYDEEGFIIRNSWGKGFADNGYTKIKNENINKFVELWCVLK